MLVLGWDHNGTHRGHLIGAAAPAPGKRRAAEAVNVGGHLVNPAALRWYPALSPDDVAAMSYASGDLVTSGERRRKQTATRPRSAAPGSAFRSYHPGSPDSRLVIVLAAGLETTPLVVAAGSASR